jgi:diguanylate cyclase (GGDEF)-like protein
MKTSNEHRIIEPVKPKKNNRLWLIGTLLLTIPAAGLALILAKNVQSLQDNGDCIGALLDSHSYKRCVPDKATINSDYELMKKEIENLNMMNKELVLQIRLSVLNGMFILVVALIVGMYALKKRFEYYDRNHVTLLSEAYSDPLTGLSNRRKFRLDLNNKLLCAKNNSAFFTIIFIDVDRFKHINDTYGHTVGDEILQSLAAILTSTIREDADSLGRLAGDEFAIITGCFTNIKVAKEASIEISRKLKCEVDKLRKKEAMDISISIGIAIYPDDGVTEKDLLTSADTAMYDAKEKGRNAPFVFYDKELHDAEKKLDHIIIKAIENKNYIVEYQPKINIRTNRCVGVEALTRLIGPDGTVISPVVFIPIAERVKKMGELTKILIDTVITDLDAFKTIPVSLNISPNQLKDRCVIHYLKKKLEEGCIQDNRLEIEITEQAEIQDVENMRSLGVLPITISIDDFGKGYNSLACLYKFREYVDTIKIDKEFSDNILDEQGYEVFKTIVGLARQFKYNIVVEGVETYEQMLKVSALNCDVIQGFFYSKPMCLAAAIEYITQLDADADNVTS